MFSRRFFVCMVIAVVLIFTVRDSYANGINPPRPSGAVAVKAVCKGRSGGNQLEVFRTRIMSGANQVEGITFVIQGATEQIGIMDIRTITLSAGAVDSNGFVNGSLIRKDQTEERTTKVQVKTNNTPLRLTGFSEAGARLSIDFATCEAIEFSSETTSKESRKSIMKK